jgi:hypothetical protein
LKHLFSTSYPPYSHFCHTDQFSGIRLWLCYLSVAVIFIHLSSSCHSLHFYFTDHPVRCC